MVMTLLPALLARLVSAHEILETLVLRTNEGAVFSINIGKSILSDEGNVFWAKVTLETTPEVQIVVCEGKSIEQVSMAAQELIANAISSGKIDTPHTVIAKPHISFEEKTPA